jgi:1-acyl-sn-glycerol-3-phosphate acyltransferase
MRAALKANLVFLQILFFIFILALSWCLFIFSRKMRAYCVSYMLHVFNKVLVWILGIRVELIQEAQDLRCQGVFFVINHFSYIDGIVAGSIFPFVFIGKSDLKNWPLLGIMIRLSETVFVDRANTSNIKNELQEVTFLLNNNVNVILFPEGTSHDGKVAIPFKSSFFAAPLESGRKIAPLTIEYKKVNGREINDANQDLLYWYGDMEFFSHFRGVLNLRSAEVQLKVNPPIEVSYVQGQNSSAARKYLSDLSQEIIYGQANKKTNTDAPQVEECFRWTPK